MRSRDIRTSTGLSSTGRTRAPLGFAAGGLAIAASMFVAAPTLAAPRASVTLANIPSDALGHQPNHFLDVQSAFPIRSITVSGTLTSLRKGTTPREACIRITAPGGTASWVLQPFASGTFPSTADRYTFRLPNDLLSGDGTWTYYFFELFDDGNDGQADARWDTVTISLNDGPPEAKDLGEVAQPGRHLALGNLGAGSAKWYRFSIADYATSINGNYVDIDTVGTASGDTEIALYDEVGRLIATDDDDGPGYLSQLTFGTGGRGAVGNGTPYDGRDGALAPGIYYVVVTPFDGTFNPAGWDVHAGSNVVNQGRLNIRTNIGEAACPADVDDGTGEGSPDGGVTIEDLLYFLTRFEAGC